MSKKAKYCAICGKEMKWYDAKATTSDNQIICLDSFAPVMTGSDTDKAMWIQKHTLNDFKSLMNKGTEQAPTVDTVEKQDMQNSLVCPYCGSDNLTFAGNKRKGFSVGKAIGKAFITPGGIGALAGFAGKKGKKNQFICMSCGQDFTK